MSEENKVETKVEAPAAPAVTEQPIAAAEPAPAPEPQVRLKAGLFKDFTLGSTLKQGPIGNVMENMKRSPMDYEKTYKESTKNIQMTEEQLQALQTPPAKKE